MTCHESVLLQEVLQWLKPLAGHLVVDGTLGRGGHARRILERTGPDGRLVGFDRDPEAVAFCRQSLAGFGDRAMIVQGDFKDSARNLQQLGIRQVQGMLLDLGVSSPQLANSHRGFSFQTEGPLDMRMNPADPLTAARIVNRFTQPQLEQLLREFGQERYARSIARRVVESRRQRPIETTRQLESIIFHAVPKSYRHGRIHPATRSFQALRIAVNQEIRSLEEFLRQAPALLEDAGRIVILSFHSLEDRVVKNAFREFKQKGLGEVLTKKPVTPGIAEIAGNPRARSAKMRVFEKRAGRVS